jgi:predicted DNA-binding transcriptional regulator YafY
MRVASTSELVRWVSQFGPEAEVLAPKRLRLEVAHRLARALALYKARSGTTERRKEAARAGA